MTQTANLETVINEVHALSINHYDEIIPLQDMEFDSLTQCGWPANKLKWLPRRKGCCPIVCGCHNSYLSRCPAELQARNLNYWIEQERQQRETFFCRFDAIA